MPREKTAGVSLCDGTMEVAFEQWTEREIPLVDSNAVPTLQGSGIGRDSCVGRVQRYVSEFRW